VISFLFYFLLYELDSVMNQPIEISSSPPPVHSVSSSPILAVRTRQIIKPKKSQGQVRVAKAGRQVSCDRTRTQGVKPHAGSSALSLRDHDLGGRTSSPPPWDIHVILIRETFFYASKLDRLDGARSDIQRTYVGII
jgi:hypothetical protein